MARKKLLSIKNGESQFHDIFVAESVGILIELGKYVGPMGHCKQRPNYLSSNPEQKYVRVVVGIYDEAFKRNETVQEEMWIELANKESDWYECFAVVQRSYHEDPFYRMTHPDPAKRKEFLTVYMDWLYQCIFKDDRGLLVVIKCENENGKTKIIGGMANTVDEDTDASSDVSPMLKVDAEERLVFVSFGTAEGLFTTSFGARAGYFSSTIEQTFQMTPELESEVQMGDGAEEISRDSWEWSLYYPRFEKLAKQLDTTLMHGVFQNIDDGYRGRGVGSVFVMESVRMMSDEVVRRKKRAGIQDPKPPLAFCLCDHERSRNFTKKSGFIEVAEIKNTSPLVNDDLAYVWIFLYPPENPSWVDAVRNEFEYRPHHKSKF